MFFLKYKYLIVSTFILLVALTTKVNAETVALAASDSTQVSYLTPNHIQLTDSIVNYGKMFLNTPYRYGSESSSSFDCSGFTSYVYRNFGYNLAHSSARQAQQFDSVDRSELKTGDLVFFSGSRRSRSVGHVGIVVDSNKEGTFNFIHASVDKGVTISSSDEDYYRRRFIKANRVVGGSPLLAVVPNISENARTSIQPEITVPASVPVTKTRKTIPAKYHKVKSGETLSDIADEYGLTLAELKNKNGLKGSRINPKQRLKVKDAETYTIVEPVQVAENKVSDVSKKAETEKSEIAATEVVSTIASHIVKKGETLFSISKLYNVSVQELKTLNDIPNGRIAPGQKLQVAQKLKPTENIAVAKPDKTIKTISHKVTSGESLYTIAKKYSVSVNDLKKANDLKGSDIHPGQTLNVNLVFDNKIEEPFIPKKEPIAIAKVEPALKHETTPKPEKKPESAAKSDVVHKPELIAKVESKEEMKAGTTPKLDSKTKIINHKVHAGENLNTIARDFKVSADELMSINNLTETRLAPGQEIIILIPPVSPATVSDNTEIAEDAGSKINVKTVVAAEAEVKVEPKVEVMAESKPKPKPEVKSESKPTVKQIAQNIESKQSAATTYKVKKGDNLSIIAKKFNMSVDDLKEINNLNNSGLNYGQVLKVSQLAEAEPKLKSEPAYKTATYKVQRGDNLSIIAKKFDMPVDELKEINKLTNTRLDYGQVLKVTRTADLVAESKSVSTTKSSTYKVKKGDNLITIAKDLNMTVDKLKELNNLDDNKINFGQELVVSQSNSKKLKNIAGATQAKGKISHHKVKPGESLYSIAQKNDCALSDLKEWNKKLGSKLSVGDEVIIRK